MKYDVFISYSTFDEAIARDVCRVLEENGICCWIALRDAKPGNPYACEIMSGIEESKMLLLIFSSNSNVSEPVASEIEEAFNKKKPIIVFLIENKPMAPELKFFLKRKHWLVAYPDYKQKLGNLVHATHDILGISKPKVVVESDEHLLEEQGSDNVDIKRDDIGKSLLNLLKNLVAKSSSILSKLGCVVSLLFFILLTIRFCSDGKEDTESVQTAEPCEMSIEQEGEGNMSQEEIDEVLNLKRILSTPRSSKGLLCFAAVNKNSYEIAYFTADEWDRLYMKSEYAKVGVSISEDGHEFIIAPTHCEDPDDGNYMVPFGCCDVEFDRVIQYKKISEFITTGYNDTKNIVEQAKGKIDSKGIKGAPAAEAAWNYKTNEYDNLQWYLPSVSELEMIYRNKDAINEFIIRYISQGERVMGHYWSSTVYDYDSSWLVDMADGNSHYYYRHNSIHVRAVALAK